MFHARKALWLALPALVLLAGNAAVATPCNVTRSQINSAIASGATASDLYNSYGGCTSSDTPSFASRQGMSRIADDLNVFTNFNVNWERIEACGYHPQRQEADCAVEIRQVNGYGGIIGAGAGSFEWVQLCVNFGAGLVPVGIGQVHVHDAPAGAIAPWDFGVVVQGQPAISGRLKNGATFPARAILSWAVLPPANCAWAPPFGNWADFRLRMDP